jgi:hypothetical protein
VGTRVVEQLCKLGVRTDVAPKELGLALPWMIEVRTDSPGGEPHIQLHLVTIAVLLP